MLSGNVFVWFPAEPLQEGKGEEDRPCPRNAPLRKETVITNEGGH